jgi:hypothetical protein
MSLVEILINTFLTVKPTRNFVAACGWMGVNENIKTLIFLSFFMNLLQKVSVGSQTRLFSGSFNQSQTFQNYFRVREKRHEIFEDRQTQRQQERTESQKSIIP